MSYLQSSGRGGAGNIVDSSKSPKILPQDLQTPTLKTPMVTTGRGGTGNMAQNRDPVETRLRQDVEPVVRRPSHGATHVGRGGTGNVFNPEEAQAAKREMLAADKNGGSSAISDDENKITRTTTATNKRNDKKDKSEKNNNRTQGEEPSGWAEKGKNMLFGKKQ
ncbi:hypothetical protein QBC46DRAFT_261801 [Diplogelasinospora grovesii]|uniref:PAR32 protein n=1 Tax=Diplogelasinospora grovesii TaxID=303347 RepID=A0AAN6N764_9PEZI|nr:hypothetical protein QBC46DRAFT_261801 [Diplogelasinospora grovesii]